MVINAMRMNHDHADQYHVRTSNWEAFTFSRRRVWRLLVVKCCHPLQRLKQGIVFFAMVRHLFRMDVPMNIFLFSSFLSLLTSKFAPINYIFINCSHHFYLFLLFLLLMLFELYFFQFIP